jgi:hypothetical protein
VYSVLSE